MGESPVFVERQVLCVGHSKINKSAIKMALLFFWAQRFVFLVFCAIISGTERMATVKGYPNYAKQEIRF